MPRTVLGMGTTMINKVDIVPAFTVLSPSGGNLKLNKKLRYTVIDAMMREI